MCFLQIDFFPVFPELKKKEASAEKALTATWAKNLSELRWDV